MQKRTTIAVVFGTRPEAIKLAPVIRVLRKNPALHVLVCTTGQHREMLEPVLETFQIRPDVDLQVMTPNQSLSELAARVLTGVDALLAEHAPQFLVVQGDTTTAFASALAAFYRKVPVGHVEAGLRTGNLHSPWPEEANRVLLSRLAAAHFAPTAAAAANLTAEGVEPASIHVTGNTVVDALRIVCDDLDRRPPPMPMLAPMVLTGRMVLITGHRRENFGSGFESICTAIARLASQFPDVHFVYPVHLNPNVRGPVQNILAPAGQANVHLIDPLPYREFIHLFRLCTLLLSDSGGVQEEAPSLGKPVLLMRDTTERPEAVACGAVKLVGVNAQRIIDETSRLLNDPDACRAMRAATNPYGDGHAAERIAAIIHDAVSGGGS